MDIDVTDRDAFAAPETKAGFDAPTRVDTVARDMGDYIAKNDARVAELARMRTSDPQVAADIARLDATIARQARRIDTMELKSARPAFAVGRDSLADPLVREHKSAFDAYVRKGDAADLRALETKAISVGTIPSVSTGDGGYLVPPEVEHEIGRRLSTVSPIRAIAGVRTVSASVYKKPFMTAGPAVGWVGEGDARTQTDTPVLAELSFPTMELYAMPAATSTLLEDAMVDVDQWLASEIDHVFAEQEGAAFVKGDGVAKPKGFLAYQTVANASWIWGKIGTVSTGAAGAFPVSNPADVLIELAYALKVGYRQNACFVMNRKTEAVVRKFRDSTGNYLWTPGLQAGTNPTLLGYPVITDDNMPDIAPDSLSIAFGDFRRGYLVVDRAGVRVLRDPYSAKPYVLFYTTKRVGGGVQDFDAIKLLKFAV